MAKRARPDQAITEKWMGKLLTAAQEVARCEEALTVSWDELKDLIREAFSEGVLGSTIKEALVTAGLKRSGSRIYQIKFELRDQALEDREQDEEAQ